MPKLSNKRKKGSKPEENNSSKIRNKTGRRYKSRLLWKKGPQGQNQKNQKKESPGKGETRELTS